MNPAEARAYIFRDTAKRQANRSARNPTVTETPELAAKATLLVDQAISTHAFVPPFSEMEGHQRQFWLQRAAA